jgi:hypothetical protein
MFYRQEFLASIAELRGTLNPFLTHLKKSLAAAEHHLIARGDPAVVGPIQPAYLKQLVETICTRFEPLLDAMDRLRDAAGLFAKYEVCHKNVSAAWVDIARMWLYRFGIGDDL